MNRRDFIWQSAAALAAAGVGGCRMFGGRKNVPPRATRGVVVSARDLSGAFDWPRLAREAGLTTIATHIGPRDVMPFLKSGRGARFLDACTHYGIQVEHELHAIDWLLPRTMFATDPSFFRMNAKGERTPDSNCCPSNPFALEVIACRAVEAARVCRSTTGRYFYWMTDNGEKCNCPKCKPLSGAEQAVIVENAIVRALRVEIDPNATLAHLAYQFTIAQPDHCDLSFPLDRFVKATVFDAIRLVVNVVVVVFGHPIILSFQTRFICPQNRSESLCGVVIPPSSAGRHKPRTNARHGACLDYFTNKLPSTVKARDTELFWH